MFLLYFLAIHSFQMTEPWGKDADLAKMEKKEERKIDKKSEALLFSAQLIRFYQTKISPIDGPRSHFVPSSSEYTKQAILKYGFFTGVALGCDRLLRENNEKWLYPVVKVELGTRKRNPVP